MSRPRRMRSRCRSSMDSVSCLDEPRAALELARLQPDHREAEGEQSRLVGGVHHGHLLRSLGRCKRLAGVAAPSE